MAKSATYPHDVDVGGLLRAKEMDIPAGTVEASDVAAATQFAADNQIERHNIVLSQPNSNATAETRVIHSAYKPGTVMAFAAGSIVAATGDSTVTIDLKKNGVSVLSAPIVLNNANTADVPEAAIISVGPYTSDDTFTIVQTVSAGSGDLPDGVFWRLVVEEKPA